MGKLDLMDWVYSDFEATTTSAALQDYYSGRAVLTTTNAEADDMNAAMLNKLHPDSQRHVFLSQDTILEASSIVRD